MRTLSMKKKIYSTEIITYYAYSYLYIYIENKS